MKRESQVHQDNITNWLNIQRRPTGSDCIRALARIAISHADKMSLSERVELFEIIAELPLTGDERISAGRQAFLLREAEDHFHKLKDSDSRVGLIVTRITSTTGREA